MRSGAGKGVRSTRVHARSVALKTGNGRNVGLHAPISMRCRRTGTQNHSAWLGAIAKTRGRNSKPHIKIKIKPKSRDRFHVAVRIRLVSTTPPLPVVCRCSSAARIALRVTAPVWWSPWPGRGLSPLECSPSAPCGVE